MVLINKGQVVLQGSVQEIKRKPGRNVARLKLDNDPEAPWTQQLPGVQVTELVGPTARPDAPSALSAGVERGD